MLSERRKPDLCTGELPSSGGAPEGPSEEALISRGSLMRGNRPQHRQMVATVVRFGTGEEGVFRGGRRIGQPDVTSAGQYMRLGMSYVTMLGVSLQIRSIDLNTVLGDDLIISNYMILCSIMILFHCKYD